VFFFVPRGQILRIHIQSGLHCRKYPNLDGLTFGEAHKKIDDHVATCGYCREFMQRFLRTDPASGAITARPDRIKRWTLNGPSTSLQRHPFKSFFVEVAQDAIASAQSPEEKVARILYFEYRLLAYNRHRGMKRAGSQDKRSKRQRRRSGSSRPPWERNDTHAQEEYQ
jgi:hypothetical protein